MTTSTSKPAARTRVQFDLRPEQLPLLEMLERCLAVRSRADLLQEAIGTLLWLVLEQRRGRKVVSVDPTELVKLRHVVEWASPASLLARDDMFEHLVARSHPWRRQLSLKGRNMTVGQLVATMRAEGMDAEEASRDLDLPPAQVREALAYHELNRDLVDAEAREERVLLEEAGYSVAPATVPRRLRRQ